MIQSRLLTLADKTRFNEAVNEVIPDLDSPSKTEIELAHVMDENLNLRKQLKYESNINEKFLLSQINECKDIIKKLAKLL